MINYIDILKEMLSASVGAGDIIMKYYNGRFSVKSMNDSTPVTDADIASSEYILSTLKASYPDFGYLSEESADEVDQNEVPIRLSKTHCFIIDPLDGTRSFVKHTGEFAVSIGLASDNEVVAGVVYAPVNRELYYALKGHGAYKVYVPDSCEIPEPFDGKRIRVSSRTEDLIAVQSDKRSDLRAEEIIARNSDKISKVLRFGSCLKGCLIAEGKADIHYRYAAYTKEWDTAGEEIICRESGAMFTDVNGGKLIANREDYRNINGIRILNSPASELK